MIFVSDEKNSYKTTKLNFLNKIRFLKIFFTERCVASNIEKKEVIQLYSTRINHPTEFNPRTFSVTYRWQLKYYILGFMVTWYKDLFTIKSGKLWYSATWEIIACFNISHFNFVGCGSKILLNFILELVKINLKLR